MSENSRVFVCSCLLLYACTRIWVCPCEREAMYVSLLVYAYVCMCVYLCLFMRALIYVCKVAALVLCLMNLFTI